MNLPDHICIKWEIEDVKSLTPYLTDEECREVLDAVKRNHDAEVGVNWDVLRYWIGEIHG